MASRLSTYWKKRDYGHEDQIGQEETPQQYADRLVVVFREVRRVLKETGTVWLNVGDAYNHVGHVPFRSGWQRPWQRPDRLPASEKRWHGRSSSSGRCAA